MLDRLLLGQPSCSQRWLSCMQPGFFDGEVSSHNIFLERNRAGQLQAVLMDFGLSQRLGGKVQAVPNPKALAYLSPEQLTNPEQIGQLSDLYSVGVVLHEVLTGQAAFEGETDYACMNAIVEGRSLPLLIRTSKHHQVWSKFAKQKP